MGVVGPILIVFAVSLIGMVVYSFFESVSPFNHPSGYPLWDRVCGCYLALLILFNYYAACFVKPGSYEAILRQRQKDTGVKTSLSSSSSLTQNRNSSGNAQIPPFSPSETNVTNRNNVELIPLVENQNQSKFEFISNNNNTTLPTVRHALNAAVSNNLNMIGSSNNSNLRVNDDDSDSSLSESNPNTTMNPRRRKDYIAVGVLEDNLNLELNELLKYADLDIDNNCKKCKYPKPERCHHCSICDRCVLKQDHHCPWINSCVGFNNHRYFYLFMVYLCLGCIYNITFSFKLFWSEVVLGSITYPFKSDSAFLRFFFSFVMSVLMFIAMGLMAAWHTYLIGSGQTIIEFYANMDLQDDGSIDGSGFFNEYDFGIINNFKLFFNLTNNRSFITIFLPIFVPPYGDGIHWLHCSEVLRNSGGDFNATINFNKLPG